MNIVDKYTLAQIGACDFKADNSLLTIPNLQRGAVWRARQVELLWDSLLQGFPIGTITVLSNETKESGVYSGQLVDGLQRVGAIIAGFRDPSPLDDTIVWIDAQSREFTDRQYAIRVTNRAHPWGYRFTGEVFSAGERNKAIYEAGYVPGEPRRNWNILNFGPADANLPIPLSYLLKAEGEDRLSQIINKCEELKTIAPEWGRRYMGKVRNLTPEALNAYFDAIDSLFGKKDNGGEYCVPAIIIDKTENLELLFERIGRQGTPLTDKELAYALMKHYWEDRDFGNINAELCKDLMPEEDLAVGVFRLFAETHGLRADVSSSFIRNVRNGSDQESVRIRNEVLLAYSHNGELLHNLIERVRCWILTCDDGSRYHPLVLTEMVMKKPYLFVLLMRLAYIDLIEKRLSVGEGFVQALSFYLHTCLWKDNKVIVRVYEAICYCEGEVTEDIIRDTIRQCISYEWAMPVVGSFRDFPALQDSAMDVKWELSNYTNERGSYLFEQLFQYGTLASDFILKLAERHYFNEHYQDYNPSRRDLWLDQNRPWDHDHIIPQSWAGDGEKWSAFCSWWINCIGNIADIPYELNRSKNANEDWSHYDQFPEQLLFHPENGRLDINEYLATDDKQVKLLFHFVRDRFISIVEPFLKILQRIHLNDGLNNTQRLRKDVLLQLKNKHPECKLYYLNRGLECPIGEQDNYAWLQPWVSISKDYGDPERVVAMAIYIDDYEKFYIDRGLRKRPDRYIEQLTSKTWYEPGHVAYGKVDPVELEDGTIRLVSRYGVDAIGQFESLLEDPLFPLQ